MRKLTNSKIMLKCVRFRFIVDLISKREHKTRQEERIGVNGAYLTVLTNGGPPWTAYRDSRMPMTLSQVVMTGN